MRFRPHGHASRRMNKTEHEWAALLDMRELVYVHEGFKFRLADKTYYTPDFIVFRPRDDGTFLIEVHEVKGHWEEDARVKWKAVAEQWPQFRFIAVGKYTAKQGGGWWEEVYADQARATKGAGDA